jgi:hypothetical protein
MVHTELLRKEVPTLVDVLTDADSHQEREKQLRRRFTDLALGDGPTYRLPIWVWRLGGAALVALPDEPYSLFQRELRRRLPGTPLLVLGVANGTIGYLPPRETYGQGLYQEQQSPYAPGGLEQAIEVSAEAIAALF